MSIKCGTLPADLIGSSIVRARAEATPEIIVASISKEPETFSATFLNARFFFTSSTSVYAQTDGSWVDESSLAEPTRETGKILRETEEIVLRAGGIVARVAGIYGPGRSFLLRKFLAGEAVIDRERDRFLNQVHRDDIASAMLLLMQSGE